MNHTNTMGNKDLQTEDVDAESPKRSIASLQGRHHEICSRAIANVLSTTIARTTYGQIVDGLPLADVAADSYYGVVGRRHPLLDQHLELSTDVLNRVDQLYSTFDPKMLKIDSVLFFAFQAASPGSRAFQTRLIEIIARSVHQIAVWLFKQGPMRPESDPLLSWRPGKDIEYLYPKGFPPTLFLHHWYRDYDQYPEGIADGVGYWAESRILGGVVLFDRRTPESAQDVDPDAIYFHSDSSDVTYRIYRLLDSQKQQLMQFLLSEVTPPPTCPLPIHGSLENRQRVDPEEPILEKGIYRDKWERRPPSEDDGDDRLRDVTDDFNYVSFNDYLQARYRGVEMRQRRESEGW
ncbi:uncharacterized protein F4812DRAFT_448055 [Daldinia caldariorum]|uniref:uncharacterized protein n=1 Tax=Daldinia caldariorum TaxID=326644 RepID=UPI002007E43B|nr:uncharacterized protein F4812DRAFT_448055 [Daldinia caldariorum]KAI1463107.1 hypothetical protein F4812DRAFT_448055 [Daldinia caldariorum]